MQECRYCMISEEKPTDLIDPCKCGGSMKYVHQKCLIDWIKNSNKPSTYQYLNNKVIYLLKCEICHYDMKYIKEYENGVLISLLKSILKIFSSTKTIYYLIFHSVIIFFFLKRLNFVIKYWKSMNRKMLSLPNNMMKLFHELAIFLSIYLGVGDIVKYYRKIFNENRIMTMNFLGKDSNEPILKFINNNKNKSSLFTSKFFYSDMSIDVLPHNDSN